MQDHTEIINRLTPFVNGLGKAILRELEQHLETSKEELANDVADIATKAMQRAWLLGQTYWQQADSDSYIQHRKSDATEAVYWQAKEDIRLAIIAAIIKGETNETI